MIKRHDFIGAILIGIIIYGAISLSQITQRGVILFAIYFLSVLVIFLVACISFVLPREAGSREVKSLREKSIIDEACSIIGIDDFINEEDMRNGEIYGKFSRNGNVQGVYNKRTKTSVKRVFLRTRKWVECDDGCEDRGGELTHPRCRWCKKRSETYYKYYVIKNGKLVTKSSELEKKIFEIAKDKYHDIFHEVNFDKLTNSFKSKS